MTNKSLTPLSNRVPGYDPVRDFAIASIPGICQGRLTLTSGTAVTTADVTGAGTLYFTPFRGNKVALYNGSYWEVLSFTERSIAVTATSGSVYDVYLYNQGGVPKLEIGTVWSSATARAEALATQDGIYVRTGYKNTRRYVGTFCADGTNTIADSGGGVTTVVGAKRFLWNAQNRVGRHMAVFDSTNSWAYTTDTIRQARANAGNKVEWVHGLQEEMIEGRVCVNFNAASNSARGGKAGIGVDSTSAFSGMVAVFYYPPAGGANLPCASTYEGYPGLGYHYLSWNEKGADGTCTFLGSNGGDSSQSGLTASGWF